MAETGLTPQQIAEAVDKGELDLSQVAPHSFDEIRAAIEPAAKESVERIRRNVAQRNAYLSEYGDRK